MKLIKVAALVLEDQHGQILLGQRRAGDSNAGKWEFPGGKVEPGESAPAALQREILEELGVTVGGFTPLTEVTYRYPLIEVHIQFFYLQMPINEEIACHAHQQLTWAKKTDLDQYDFLEANREVVQLIAKH